MGVSGGASPTRTTPCHPPPAHSATATYAAEGTSTTMAVGLTTWIAIVIRTANNAAISHAVARVAPVYPSRATYRVYEGRWLVEPGGQCAVCRRGYSGEPRRIRRTRRRSAAHRDLTTHKSHARVCHGSSVKEEGKSYRPHHGLSLRRGRGFSVFRWPVFRWPGQWQP